MRTIHFILFLISIPLILSGQSAEQEVVRLKQNQGILSEESTQDLKKHEDSGNDNWNFSVGTSFQYMKGVGSGMMFYAAPTYTLALNQKWALHGGMIASQYRGFNNSYSEEFLLPNTFSSMALFVAASYQMNDRLVLHGTGTKQLLSTPVTPFTPYPMDNLSLGATYRIGNNFTIGASVQMRQSRGYSTAPFGGSMYQSPFFW